jgi:hypothetical protein
MCFVEEGVRGSLDDVFDTITSKAGSQYKERVCGFCVAKHLPFLYKNKAKALFKLKEEDVLPLVDTSQPTAVTLSQGFRARRISMAKFNAEAIIATAYKVHGGHSQLSATVRKNEQKRSKNLDTRKRRMAVSESARMERRTLLQEKLQSENIFLELEPINLAGPLYRRDGLEWANFTLFESCVSGELGMEAALHSIRENVGKMRERAEELATCLHAKNISLAAIKLRLVQREFPHSPVVPSAPAPLVHPGSHWADTTSYALCYNFVNFRLGGAEQVSRQVEQVLFFGNQTEYMRFLILDAWRMGLTLLVERGYLNIIQAKDTSRVGPFPVHFEGYCKEPALRQFVDNKRKLGWSDKDIVLSIPSSLRSNLSRI